MNIIHSDPYRPTLTYKLAFTSILMSLLLGLPTLLFFTWGHYIDSFNNKDSYNSFLLYASISSVIILSVIYICYKQRKQRALFLNHFKEVGFFEPLKSDECKTITGSHYAGLDIKNGILLVIAHTNTSLWTLLVPRDYLVMGFDMNSFTTAELQGQRMTIYTGKPDIPFVIIEHKNAPAIFERLSAMRKRHYHYENSVPGYVTHSAKRIAEENNLNLVLSRFN